MAGWGLAVSAIIVLANTAEIAAIYLFEVLGLHAAAESLAAKVLLGCFFIAAMTYVSFRGILISERLQNVLIAVQFTVLIGVSVIALSKVFGGTAGPQAITPKLDWIIPTGVSMSSAAQAIICASSSTGGGMPAWQSVRKQRIPSGLPAAPRS